jgi:fatty-acyl-CoA synthase
MAKRVTSARPSHLARGAPSCKSFYQLVEKLLATNPTATAQPLARIGGTAMAARLERLEVEGQRRRGALLGEVGALLTAARHVVPSLVRGAVSRQPTLLGLALGQAQHQPDALALESEHERLTWSDVAKLSSKVAHVLSDAGVRQGDIVALMGRSSPSYVVFALGASRVGATTALINPHLTGGPLAHAFATSGARVALVDESFRERVTSEHVGGGRVIHYGGSATELERLVANADEKEYPPARVSANDDFVYIYTSGTTGLPKPCRVSHSRATLAGALYGALMFEFRPGDKLYAPLPFYHSNGMLIAAGSCITMGVPLAMRDPFSARKFLDDVRRYDATAMIYIGELCRYLLAVPATPEDRQHRLRVAVGNGLRPDIWSAFRDRFGIAKVREFYTATEAPGILMNRLGVEGSVGRPPPFFARLYKLAKFDPERGDWPRDGRGFCIPCEVGETGELLIKIPSLFSLPGMQYRGYTDRAASSARILADVFTKGDRFFRTGDLLRCDEEGYFTFVDRIGDTYRCKGENVSTAEVGDVLAGAPGIREVAVVGVRIPSHDGQYGLVGVVPENGFDAAAFHRTAQELPSYAQPRFVRVLSSIETTATNKQQKDRIRREGIDPGHVADPLYAWSDRGYVPLTPALYEAVKAGTYRL